MMFRRLAFTLFLGYGLTFPTDQIPLTDGSRGDRGHNDVAPQLKSPKLHGRFLHITDFHPDPHYKLGSSTEDDNDCHRGKGRAGIYGAERSECDSPLQLVDATFDWLREHVKDTVDFVIWTGDSARHDEDLKIPRTEQEILNLNEMMVDKFVELFGTKSQGSTGDLTIPIVPNFGNNDMMPHNILGPAPNFWTKKYLQIWDRFIPEEQRHTFEHGGWFYVEVIPNRLAVFSLNTIYFFANNAAVDGCSAKSEPGYAHFEWLRVQLQFLRERGVKAIMTGHVPPARTESKQSWDETCWQKYALWMQQYRDVVVGSVYGHMNIDHFMFQDFKHIDKKTLGGEGIRSEKSRESMDEKIIALKKAAYLTELRIGWSEIPSPPKMIAAATGFKDAFLRAMRKWMRKEELHQTDNRDDFLEAVGGHWGESYSLSLVSASIVPNYFPMFRVVEYNVSGLDSAALSFPNLPQGQVADLSKEDVPEEDSVKCAGSQGKKSKSDKAAKKSKRSFTIPLPPSESSPPGPAYSPQPLSLIGYTNYFANLTKLYGKEKGRPSDVSLSRTEPEPHVDINSRRVRKNGRYDQVPLVYEVEYDTRNDSTWYLPDLTLRSYLDLARKIGKYQPASAECASRSGNDMDVDVSDDEDENEDDDEPTVGAEKKHKHKKHKKKHKKGKKGRGDANRAWLTFVRRAFVSAIPDDELKDEFEIDGE